MKNTRKRTIALLLICTLVLSLIPFGAQAAAGNHTALKRYNIMLVIDGSGSLTSPGAGQTDPNGMRYALIDELLGILENGGHNVGAIVFSGTDSTDNNLSDKQMRDDCIMLSPKFYSLDAPAHDGSPATKYLKDQIIATGVNESERGGTDIGTALLVAQQELLKQQTENGLESIVFLFTDGNTSFYKNPQGILEKSYANRDKATLEISRNGIRLFGAFLNHGGTLDSDEMKRLVCAANGISESSEEFSKSFAEIRNADNIHAATNIFLRFLGFIDDWDPEHQETTEDIHDTFLVPGIGLEEMIIRLYSPNGDDLPELNVKITDPDNNVLKLSPTTNSRTFQLYRLVKPSPAGVWTLDITVPEDNDIAYAYTPILSLYIDSGLEITPDPATLHVNKTATFSCYLSQNGAKCTDPRNYAFYDCVITMKNIVDGSEITHEIQPNGNGLYTTDLFLETYGQYEATATFTCGDDIVVESNTISLNLQNEAPISQDTSVNIKYGLFQRETTKIELSTFSSDREDESNIRYICTGTTCPTDGFDLDEDTGLILITNNAIGNGEIHIDVTDTQGASTAITVFISSKNVTLQYILILIALVIAVVLSVIIYIIKKPRPNGELILSFSIGDDRPYSLSLPVPGAEDNNSCSLKSLIDHFLKDDPDSSLEDSLKTYNDEFQKIKASAVVHKNKGTKTGAVKVQHGKNAKTLFNTSYRFEIKGTRFTLTFSSADTEVPPSPFDRLDDFVPTNNNERSPFDDLLGEN